MKNIADVLALSISECKQRRLLGDLCDFLLFPFVLEIPIRIWQRRNQQRHNKDKKDTKFAEIRIKISCIFYK